MQINADHAAACWVNVKAGIENGTISPDGEVDDTAGEGEDAQ